MRVRASSSAFETRKLIATLPPERASKVLIHPTLKKKNNAPSFPPHDDA